MSPAGVIAPQARTGKVGTVACWPICFSCRFFGQEDILTAACVCACAAC